MCPAVKMFLNDIEQSHRFFFPDSPTNAWFLTPEERAKAVHRIKSVIASHIYYAAHSLTHASIRKTKQVSRTSTSRSSSKDSPSPPTLPHHPRTHSIPHRFWEAIYDPKTWLFAALSAIDNVPNSLTNQRQIIVSSFGFSTLQTTLLGCVDGTVEIVTIWTGVTLAARLKDSRAYVGTVYFIPNILGVLLINLLPWENKIGLLFGQWLTGAYLSCLL